MALGQLHKLMARRRDGERRASAPPGKAIYVVGDIHGRADLLHVLLRKIAIDAARHEAGQAREVIFLGDYVDRGPESRQVVDLVLSTMAETSFWDVTALKGNHEESMLRFLQDPSHWPAWSQYGARETLLSYGVTPPLMTGDMDMWDELRDRLWDAMPPAHWTFFNSLALSAERGDYLCVHAGVRPGVALERQSEQDVLWIRDDFLAREQAFAKVIVHGHTPGEAFIGAHRIGLDTGAYATGVLTAVKLKGAERRLIQARRDVEAEAG